MGVDNDVDNEIQDELIKNDEHLIFESVLERQKLTNEKPKLVIVKKSKKSSKMSPEQNSIPPKNNFGNLSKHGTRGTKDTNKQKKRSVLNQFDQPKPLSQIPQRHSYKKSTIKQYIQFTNKASDTILTKKEKCKIWFMKKLY